MRNTLFKRFNLRYMTTPAGDQGGAGAGNSGDGTDNAGSTNTTDSKTPSGTKTDANDEGDDADGEKKFTQADINRIVQTRLAQERKGAGSTEGSGTPQGNGDVAQQIQTAVDTALAAAEAKSHAALRLSEAKGIAATLGFADPALVTQLVGDLSDVPVTNGEVDIKALTTKVEAVLAKYPYLKGATQSNQIPGVGVTGAPSTPTVQPGTARIRQAIADSAKK
ncbi:hypothetical protein [Timonella senegalensis]|uniref:hypothetical protein n=1 Tax=Timonella senegalensis TaxID=1465825 RepID=UPI002FDE5893